MHSLFFRLNVGLLLATIIMGHGIVDARPEYGPYLARHDVPRSKIDSFENTEQQDNFYIDQMKRYPQNNPNFLANWPYLTDLVPKNDYDENTSNRYQMMPTPVPLQSNLPLRNSVNENFQKKNVNYKKEYMSACHFKICNMGRKRNVHFFGFF